MLREVTTARLGFRLGFPSLFPMTFLFPMPFLFPFPMTVTVTLTVTAKLSPNVAVVLHPVQKRVGVRRLLSTPLTHHLQNRRMPLALVLWPFRAWQGVASHLVLLVFSVLRSPPLDVA
jgi:uncharacterized membrane protein YbhN (UPF0104 family)